MSDMSPEESDAACGLHSRFKPCATLWWNFPRLLRPPRVRRGVRRWNECHCRVLVHFIIYIIFSKLIRTATVNRDARVLVLALDLRACIA